MTDDVWIVEGKQIPKTLDVCGITIHTEISDSMEKEMDTCSGVINFKDKKLYLSRKTLESNSQGFLLNVLIHECIHMIRRNGQHVIYMESDKESRLIEEYTTKIQTLELIHLFKHNPKLLEMLNKECSP